MLTPKAGCKIVKDFFGKTLEIPETWNLCSLVEFVNDKSDIVAGPFGSNLKVSDYRTDGVPIIRLQNIERNNFINENIKYISPEKAEELKYHSYQPNDIVLAKLGDPIGKTCVIPDYVKSGIVVADVVRIRTLNKEDTKFLEYALNSDFCSKQLNGNYIGTTRPRVNLDQIRYLKLCRPPSTERQGITSILSNVDKLIQKTDQIIEQTQRLKKGLMQKLLTKGIGHDTYQELTLFPSYLSTMIPEDWSISKFGAVTKRITYGFTNPMPHTEEGPWLITAKDIKHGRINYETAGKTTAEVYKQLLSDKSRPRLGTVLITKDGTLGEVGIVDREGICVNQSVASLEPTEAISSEFLALCLQSPITKRIIEAHSPSTTIKHISITDLAEWKFGLPPLAEQKRIISVLSSMDAHIANYHQSKSKLQNIKQGLMQNLLTGKIRVKV